MALANVAQECANVRFIVAMKPSKNADVIKLFYFCYLSKIIFR